MSYTYFTGTEAEYQKMLRKERREQRLNAILYWTFMGCVIVAVAAYEVPTLLNLF